MRRVTAVCIIALSFSLLHNIYLFSTDDEEGIDGDDLGQLNDGGLLTRFVSSSIRRVKRRIFYKNDTLPTMDTAVFGNRTGRNNTISLVKLLNKNYYIIKKRYFEMLANKSRLAAPSKFHGRDYLARKKAEEAAKKAAAGIHAGTGAPGAHAPTGAPGAHGPTVAPSGGGEHVVTGPPTTAAPAS